MLIIAVGIEIYVLTQNKILEQQRVIELYLSVLLTILGATVPTALMAIYNNRTAKWSKISHGTFISLSSKQKNILRKGQRAEKSGTNIQNDNGSKKELEELLNTLKEGAGNS